MPKIPRRQETAKTGGIANTPYIPPYDPTGGLRVAAQVTQQIQQDAQRRVELAQRDVENLQLRAFDNGYRALRTKLAGEYNNALPNEVVGDGIEFAGRFLKMHDEGVSELLEGLPEERRKQVQSTIDMGRIETESALHVKHQQEVNNALQKEWNETLTMTKEEVYNGVRVGTDVDSTMSFFGHKMRQIKFVVEEGFGSSKLTPKEIQSMVRDQQGEATHKAIRAALDENNEPLAREIYAQYGTLIEDTPYGKVGETSMRRYIQLRGQDNEASTITRNIHQEFLNNPMYRNPDGKLSSDGYAALESAVIEVTAGKDDSFTQKVRDGVNTLVRNDEKISEVARQERVTALIAELKRAGKTEFVPTAEHYETLGPDGVDSVLAHFGQGKGRPTKPGAVDGFNKAFFGEDGGIDAADRYLNANLGKFSESDALQFRGMIESARTRDAAAKKQPEKYGTFTATQAVSLGEDVALSNKAPWYDAKKGKVKDPVMANRFKLLMFREVANFNEKLTPQTVEVLAKKVMAVLALESEPMSVTKVDDWGWFDKKVTSKDADELIEAARAEGGNIEELYGQYATASGVPGLTGATVKTDVSAAIGTMYPDLDPKEQRALTVDVLLNGIGEAGEEGRKVLQYMYVSDPENWIFQAPHTGTLVPQQYREEAFAMYAAMGIVASEVDVFDLWRKKVTTARGDEAFKKYLTDAPKAAMRFLSDTRFETIEAMIAAESERSSQ